MWNLGKCLPSKSQDPRDVGLPVSTVKQKHPDKGAEEQQIRVRP